MSNTIWRLELAKYADTAFSGIGSAKYGGRWNSPGQAVVYASSTLSLAVLEKLVHTKLEDLPFIKFVAFGIELSDSIIVETYKVNQLPSTWQDRDCPELAAMGDRWFQAGTSPVLSVPSAIVPQENNYLLNPNHADFSDIMISPPEPFTLDPRLWL